MREASCFNRWYDKLQLIVCSNGKAMMNFEHTAVDGHTVLRMAGDVYADTLVGKLNLSFIASLSHVFTRDLFQVSPSHVGILAKTFRPTKKVPFRAVGRVVTRGKAVAHQLVFTCVILGSV
jgi:hypothetical protein